VPRDSTLPVAEQLTAWAGAICVVRRYLASMILLRLVNWANNLRSLHTTVSIALYLCEVNSNFHRDCPQSVWCLSLYVDAGICGVRSETENLTKHKRGLCRKADYLILYPFRHCKCLWLPWVCRSFKIRTPVRTRLATA